jgi:hypothetical protein
MQVDDSKYKVYIYNLEDELSSESEPEDGKLVFLPDIEKHLRSNRIPHQALLSSNPDSVGRELVLYSVPSSLTVPEEQDSVRRAIVETRARLRGKQQAEGDAVADHKDLASSSAGDNSQSTSAESPSQPDSEDPDSMDIA